VSSSTLAGEVIGAAIRQLAMLVVWAIVIVAVVAAIVIGLRALRQRQDSGLRDQTADRHVVARPAITRATLVTADPRTHPAAPRPSAGVNRGDCAPLRSRVPVQSAR
jgi:hypothetical protein